MDDVALQSAPPEPASSVILTPPDKDSIPSEARKVDPQEQALVTHYNTLVKVAPFLQTWYERFDADRTYVNEECLLLDDEDVVSTNYILRNQVVLLANLYARDPAIAWTQAPLIGSPPPLLDQFGKALDIFCHKMGEEVDLRRQLRTGIQEASTCGWAIFTLSVQEDFARDPLGLHRQDDQLDNFARYQWLCKRRDAGQFSQDAGALKELADLEKVCAEYLNHQVEADLLNNPMHAPPQIDPRTGQPMLDPVTGQPMPPQQDPTDPRLQHVEQLRTGVIPPDMDAPEIARYLGFNLDPIQPEDYRFDWSISRTTDLYHGQWMAYRTFIDYDAFGSKFTDVTPDEIGGVTLYGADGRQVSADKRWTRSGTTAASYYDAESPSDRKTMETNSSMGRAAVWTMWHKGQGRVYVWTEGLPRFLQNYVPTNVGRRWYPFYILGFNTVTGRVIPLSDTTLTRQLQDELNRRRTYEAEAQKASFPRFFIKRGSLQPGEKESIENSNPYQVIELTAPDDVTKALLESKPLPFNKELYDRSETRMELEMMSGVSRNAAGSAEGDVATSAAIANEQMGVQVDYRRSLVEEFIFDIMYDFAYIGVQVFPEENFKKICGPDAYVPLLDRETFLRYLKLEVRAGSTGRPNAEKDLKTYETFATIAKTLGLPIDSEPLVEDIMYAMGKNNWRKYLLTPQKMLQQKMLGMPIGPAGGAPPGGAPAGAGGNATLPTPTPGSGRPPVAAYRPPAPGSVPGPV